MREQKGGAKVASDEVVPPAEVCLEAAHERVHTAHLAQREDRLHNTRSLLLPHLHHTSHHCVCRIYSHAAGAHRSRGQRERGAVLAAAAVVALTERVWPGFFVVPASRC
jgi:hypothetical protein